MTYKLRQLVAHIDQQLDHMLLAFKRLCRYDFTFAPQSTAAYIQAYREMWDTPDEAEVRGAGV